jgi:hypothetical protein
MDKKQSLSLYNVAGTLKRMLDARDEATEAGEMPELVKTIDEDLVKWHVKAVKKVNTIAESVQAYEAAAAQCTEEAKRLHERARLFHMRVQRIKEAALYAMQVLGAKSFSTPKHSIRVQANGGRQALETNIAQLPEELRRVTVKMSERLWRSLSRNMSKLDCPEVLVAIVDPDTEAIRKRLSELVQCPECKGMGYC